MGSVSEEISGFNARLKDVQARLGLTTRDFAAEIGIAERTLHQVRTTGKPSFDVLVAIIKYLRGKVDTEWLLLDAEKIDANMVMEDNVPYQPASEIEKLSREELIELVKKQNKMIKGYKSIITNMT